jgi:hypothetical protein
MLRPGLALSLLLCSAVQAQSVYRWSDAEGNIHYTDDATTIPKGATVVATDGSPISEMGAPPPVTKVAVVTQPAQVAATHATDPSIPSTSEQYWRGQFRAAREKIHKLEDDLAADNHKIDTNGFTVSNRYNCNPGNVYTNGGYATPVYPNGYYNNGNCIATIDPEYQRTKDRLVKNKQALERAKEELHELERQASFNAVPNEWRR